MDENLCECEADITVCDHAIAHCAQPFADAKLYSAWGTFEVCLTCYEQLVDNGHYYARQGEVPAQRRKNQ